MLRGAGFRRGGPVAMGGRRYEDESDEDDMEENDVEEEGESGRQVPNVVSPLKKDKPGGDKGKAGDAAAGDKLKVEKKRRRPPLEDTNLISALGFTRILEIFPKRVRYAGPGHEREYLRNLMCRYKEWAYELYDGLAFEDLVERVDKLAGKARIRDFMDEIRTKQRDAFIAEKYGEKAAKRVKEAGKVKITAPRPKPAATGGKAAKNGSDLPLSAFRGPVYNRYGELVTPGSEGAAAAQEQTVDGNTDDEEETFDDNAEAANTAAAAEATPVAAGKELPADDISGSGGGGGGSSSIVPPKRSTEAEVLARVARNKQLAMERLQKRRELAEAEEAAAAAAAETRGGGEFDEFGDALDDEGALFAAIDAAETLASTKRTPGSGSNPVAAANSGSGAAEEQPQAAAPPQPVARRPPPARSGAIFNPYAVGLRPSQPAAPQAAAPAAALGGSGAEEEMEDSLA